MDVYGDRGALRYTVLDQEHVEASIGPNVAESHCAKIPVPKRFRRPEHEYLRQNVTGFVELVAGNEEHGRVTLLRQLQRGADDAGTWARRRGAWRASRPPRFPVVHDGAGGRSIE